jgi:RNA polymerase sigma-70 factor (ECF subfamily)
MLEPGVVLYRGKNAASREEPVGAAPDRSMNSSSDDLTLARRMAVGDESALRELYALHGQRLYTYALHLTNDPAVAEDVVQDCLVAAWQGAGRFRGEGRLIAWLLGMVYHKALNATRRLPPAALDEETPDARMPSLVEQAATSERARCVRRSLANLSSKHRTVLELVFYHGLSLSEVAKICKCPVGTIKSRLSYAKGKLRKDLRRQGLKAEDMA